MVLVTADAVESHLLGVLHLVKEFVIKLMPLLGVEEMAGHIDPHTAIFLGKILWQKAVWHQMEPGKVHGQTSCMSGSGWVSGHATHRLRYPTGHVLSRGKPGAPHCFHVGFG